jgi:hypothetical protein
MKLISFDVGIKNMAYCIFEAEFDSLRIQDWGVLNLMDDVVVAQACTCNLKQTSKKQPIRKCDRKAKYTKNDQYFCETHANAAAKDNSWIIRNKLNSIASIKKMGRDELVDIGNKMNFFPEEGAPKTKKGCLELVLEQFDARGINAVLAKRAKTAGDTDLITVGRNMKQCLDDLLDVDDITHVIMENQISPIATRMKTVQGMLAQYYIMQPNTPYIEFVSSVNKLKHFVIKAPDVDDNATISNQISSSARDIYKEHKKTSVDICNKFLEINPTLGNWVDVLNTPKKDDLADAFLQGIWYLKHTKLITYAENLKINSITLS